MTAGNDPLVTEMPGVFRGSSGSPEGDCPDLAGKGRGSP